MAGEPVTGAPLEVSPLQRAELALAARLLAAALQDDPGWAHVVPDPDRRHVALTTVTRVALRDALPFGAVLAAREGDRLAGVAVWLPPGRYPMSVRRKLRTAPAMAALALRTPRDIAALARFGAGVDAAFPAEPVWYLQVLGVHPGMQRRGIGHRLLRPVLAEADRTTTTCYLETAKPRNVAYYQRSGFRVTAPPTPLHPGGPPMTRMNRPPAAAARCTGCHPSRKPSFVARDGGLLGRQVGA